MAARTRSLLQLAQGWPFMVMTSNSNSNSKQNNAFYCRLCSRKNARNCWFARKAHTNISGASIGKCLPLALSLLMPYIHLLVMFVFVFVCLSYRFFLVRALSVVWRCERLVNDIILSASVRCIVHSRSYKSTKAHTTLARLLLLLLLLLLMLMMLIQLYFFFHRFRSLALIDYCCSQAASFRLWRQSIFDESGGGGRCTHTSNSQAGLTCLLA